MTARFRLDDRVCVVTGASKGIGAAIAVACAEAGARVVVSSRKQESVDAVAAALTARGLQAAAVACHVGKADDRARLVDFAVKTYGGVDVLVNNAATNPVFGPLLDADDAAFDKIYDVNVKAPLDLMKRVQPLMVARGRGSILNISSIEGVQPSPMLAVYSSSKAALISLTKAAANEWGGAGVRVNAICPGLVDTKFAAVIMADDAIRDSVVGRQPIARAAQPDEIAGMAVFLASDAASYCTGQAYLVDGGHCL
jgi:dehydrogenase/reductase SDR family member 4